MVKKNNDKLSQIFSQFYRKSKSEFSTVDYKNKKLSSSTTVIFIKNVNINKNQLGLIIISIDCCTSD